MPKQKAAEALFDQLSKTLETDGEELVSKLKVELSPIACPDTVDFTCIESSITLMVFPLGGTDLTLPIAGNFLSGPENNGLCVQGLVLFKIDDAEWTLDLRSGKGKVSKGGAGSDKPDLTLTISDDNFVKLVMGKMGPQQVLLDMSTD